MKPGVPASERSRHAAAIRKPGPVRQPLTAEQKRRDVEMVNARVRYHHATHAVFDSVPELHGKMFRPLLDRYAERDIPPPLTIPMSFSMTLLDLVGGLEMLLYFWEPET